MRVGGLVATYRPAGDAVPLLLGPFLETPNRGWSSRETQMEGANLYDVFQKISKGEYEPLPADMFSPTLRSLVVRMLQVGQHGLVGLRFSRV